MSLKGPIDERTLETIVDALHRGAALHPDRVAVRARDGELAWSALHARSNQLAHRLRATGAGADTVVAVCLDRGLDLVIAVHAILKAGCAFLPLHPDDPPARHARLLADSRVRRVVTSSARAASFDGHDTFFVEAPGSSREEDLAHRPSPDDLAYVIYTSGSTGEPKGVAMTHAGLFNRIRWMQSAYPLTDADVLCQKTVVTFDPSVWELLWWALPGASVTLAPPAHEHDPRAIGRLVQTHGITVLYFVPTLLGLFLDWMEIRPVALPSLRRVFVSGEKLTAELVSRFHRLLPASVELVNLYGPTEAAIDVTHHACRRHPPYDDVPIGLPIDGVTLHVLDEQLAPVDAPGAGELCIEGICLARGYHFKPELTARSFVELPGAGRRVYRTGDLVRRDPSTGELSYLGRIDDQIKLRGARIEPGEIEHALRQLPEVHAALVAPFGEGIDRALHAMLAAGPGLDPRRVGPHLESTLPRTWIPARVLLVDTPPILPSGKVDRRAAWAQLADLRERVTDRRSPPGPTPLSPAQTALWFEQQVRPEAAVAFSNPSALRVRGSLDVARLAEAVQRLVARHTVLGLAIAPGPEGPVALPLRHSPALAIQPPLPESADLRAALGRHAAVPFDLDPARPLARFDLFPLGPDDHVLLVNLHHIVADGWSKAVLLEDLLALYDTALSGAQPPAPAAAPTWVEHAVRQRARRASPEHASDLAWWAAQLDPPPPALAFPGAAVDTGAGGRIHEIHVAPPVADKLRAVARAARSPLSAVLLAAFFTMLYRVTRQRDLVVGVPSAGRTERAFDRTVGLFVRTLPIRVAIDPDQPFASLVEDCRRALFSALRHQEVGFEEIVRVSRTSRAGGGMPLVQAMFQIDNLPLPKLSASGIRLEPIVLDTGAAQVPLSVSMREDGGPLVGTVEVDTGRLDPVLGASVADDFGALLEAVSADPSRSARALSAASAADRARIEGWNRTEGSLPAGDVLDIVGARLGARPDAVAIEHASGIVTYGSLARGIGALAAIFTAAGLRPGDRLAAAVEAGPFAVAGALACWWLGATWVPFDAARDPEEILASCRPRVVVRDSAIVGGPSIPAWPALIAGDCAPPPRVEERDADALVLFTSGSTGRPKGVRLTHRNLLALTQSFRTCYEVGPDDALLPVTSPYAASFVGEAFPILAAGGRLVLLDAAISLDPIALREAVVGRGITILSTVPSLVATLEAHPGPLGALRLLLSGGEPLRPADVRDLRRRVQVVNSYGLTEGGVCSTWHVLPAEQPTAGRVPIGRPIPGTRCHILDEALEPVPIGVEGELFLAGHGLAAGFIAPEDEAGRFVHGILGEARLLRTGDRARWLPSGEMEHAGRVDRQVQVRGHRVEPAEVERALALHPRVAEAHVGVRGRLVAWIVVEGAPPRGEELRSWVAARLPRHMVPEAFAVVARLPRGPSGAVNEGALPDVSGAPDDQEGAPPPETDTERQIHAIWCEILERPAIGTSTNFFDAGGHSLLLVRVQARLETRLGRVVPLLDLLRFSTIRELAAHVDLGAPEPDLAAEDARAVRRRAAFGAFSTRSRKG